MPSFKRPRKSLRRRLRSRFKALSSVSKKYLDVGGNPTVNDGNDEPLTFGQRAVLKVRGRVAVSKIVSLHEASKRCSVLGSALVAVVNQKLQLTGSPHPNPKQGHIHNELEILNRCAIRCLLEERLRTLVRAMRVKRPYPFKFRTLRYLEGFYRANPRPNQAEVALLRKIGRIQMDHIWHWFAIKRDILKPLRSIPMGRMQRRIYETSQRSVFMPQKPLSRH